MRRQSRVRAKSRRSGVGRHTNVKDRLHRVLAAQEAHVACKATVMVPPTGSNCVSGFECVLAEALLREAPKFGGRKLFGGDVALERKHGAVVCAVRVVEPKERPAERVPGRDDEVLRLDVIAEVRQQDVLNVDRVRELVDGC